MAKLFFLLSGEHPTLPFSELKSILEAEGHKYYALEELEQVLRLEMDVDDVKSIMSRSAMTRIASLELFRCNAAMPEILEITLSASFEGFIERGESFVVRIRRVRKNAPHISVEGLEKKLGELILGKVKGTRVNLESPNKTFFGILTENKFVFGLKVAEISPRPFVDRKPKRKPFFHPTAMYSKLARCMVNLAQPKYGDVILDPFCGTASMLVEAGLIGCRVIGIDVRRRMVVGSLRNLSHYGLKTEGIMVADARHLPVAEVDCVVTDPPYGRSATTLGFSTEQIVEDFLSSINSVLPTGRRICMASPKAIGLKLIGKKLGFKHVESHYVYVHRSLTREIAVFEMA